VPATNWLLFTDAAAAGRPQYFYRAVEQ